MHPSIVPVAFTNEAKRHMFQLPLTGSTFDEDNKVVYHLLKSFLVDMAGLTWAGSKVLMQQRRDVELFWHGQIITMAKVSCQSIQNWQRQKSKSCSIRMREVCPSKW